MKRPAIIPYQPAWPAEFQAIAATQQQALGGLALRIDHIGSTSVPGLPAKDVIDVQVSVAALEAASVAAIRAALGSLGYRPAEGLARDHRPPNATGPDEDWAKLYFDAPAVQRRTHTHVRVLGRANQRYALLFRDYLRAHPGTAAAYAELKRRLAEHLADPADYPDVKDPAVDLIYLPAEEWATRTAWEP
jgi:GrpB-like predicted nucleotidyltransferase (UPF0157 family)